jgi:putrescine transport system permease protein
VTNPRSLSLAFTWAWLLPFSVAPLCIILVIALARPADQVPPFHFALDPSSLSIAASDELYRSAFWLSLRTAALSTLFCLAIGYPMALGIARANERWRTSLLLALMLPFWTGFLMRINAWIGMLRDDGWINAALTFFGFAPARLLYTDAALMIGMVYTYLPFMVLPVYARLAKLDATLLEAAADLGAAPFQAWFRVTLPLSLPGIAAGVALVFIPCVGEFVIPELLGGPEAQLIGRVMWEEFFQNHDWPMAASIAWLLLMLLVVLPVGLRAALFTSPAFGGVEPRSGSPRGAKRRG